MVGVAQRLLGTESELKTTESGVDGEAALSATAVSRGGVRDFRVEDPRKTGRPQKFVPEVA